MYNISKVAKGEILVFFNEVFDALCKVRHTAAKASMCDLIVMQACGRLRAVREEWC